MQLSVSFPSLIATAAQLLSAWRYGHRIQGDFRRQAPVYLIRHMAYPLRDPKSVRAHA